MRIDPPGRRLLVASFRAPGGRFFRPGSVASCAGAVIPGPHASPATIENLAVQAGFQVLDRGDLLMLRTVTRNRGQFPTEQAALKVLYLAVRTSSSTAGRTPGSAVPGG